MFGVRGDVLVMSHGDDPRRGYLHGSIYGPRADAAEIYPNAEFAIAFVVPTADPCYVHRGLSLTSECSGHFAAMLETSTSRVTPMASRGNPNSLSSTTMPPLISVRAWLLHWSAGTSAILDPWTEVSFPSSGLYGSVDPLHRDWDVGLVLDVLLPLLVRNIRFAPRRAGLQHGKQALTTPRHSSACVQMLVDTSVPSDQSATVPVQPTDPPYTAHLPPES
jgi:hypothetical protein